MSSGGSTPSITGVVFEGDSITEGGGANNTLPWPTQFNTLTGIPIINVANSGTTMQQMRANYSGEIGPGPYYTSGQYNILVLNGGTNDFALDDQSDLGLRGYLQEEVSLAKATGYKVYVSTITPRSISGTWDTSREDRRLSFNTWLRSNYTTFADGLVDFDAGMTTADFYDGIHPSNEGAAKMAAITRDVLVATN